MLFKLAFVVLVGLTTVLTRAQKLSEYAAHPIGVFNPYNFQYSVDHPDGSLSSRLEKGDQSAVTGSYQIVGANGLQRTVNYIADTRGFRAFVDSNEPGVKSGEYPPSVPETDEYKPSRYNLEPKPIPTPDPSPPARRVPASHQSQIRVQHKGATFSSHIDFGPADHLHDEYGNIISLTKSGNGTLPENPITTVHRPSNTTFSLYQEKPVRGANGQPLYEEFVPNQFSPTRPLHIVGQAPTEIRHDNDGLHIGHHGTRAGRRLEDVNAVSGVLHLNRQQQVPQSDVPARLNDGRRFPQKGAVSEQVAHSPTLYFSTANKEEEGGAIITKNNLNPPVRIVPSGGGIAQQGTSFRASVPKPQSHNPKNIPLGPRYGQLGDSADHPRQPTYPHAELVSVNVEPFDKRLADVKGEYYLRGHDGELRRIVYEAGKDGFRAHVDTDELKVVSYKPIDVDTSPDRKYQAYPVNVDSPKIVGQGDVFKLDKPLERGPRPTLYLGHDLRSTEPAPFRTRTLASPRVQNQVPVSVDIEDLKRRPIHFVDDSPLVLSPPPKEPAQTPHYYQTPQNSPHPTTTQSSRQTFTSQSPKSKSSLQGTIYQDPYKFQTSPRPHVSMTVPPNPSHQTAAPGQNRVGRKFSDGTVTQPGYATHDQSFPQQQRHVLNGSITEPRLLVDPSDEVQRQPGFYRQPYHGAGFKYQHTAVHEPLSPQAPKGTPEFNPLDAHRRLPSAQLSQQPEDASAPKFNSHSEVPSRHYQPTQNQNVIREQVPELTFGSLMGQSFPHSPVVPQNPWQNTGHLSTPPQPDVRFPSAQLVQSIVQPARPFDRNTRIPVGPNQFGSRRQAHQPNVPARENLTNVKSMSKAQHPAARAFGEPVISPNLKVPASEAIRTGPGTEVNPAPIKHFGPPGATPLPPIFQTTGEKVSYHQTSTTSAPTSDFSIHSRSERTSPNDRLSGRGRPTTPARGSRKLDPTQPLLRMYDNGVVIGGPEPQKISYDPINDEPLRHQKSLRGHNGSNTLQSGYAPRNFFPSVIYNPQDQEDHLSDFNKQTNAPDLNARLIGETVTPTQPGSRPSRLPSVPTTVSPTPELKSFSPANNANLMSFEVKRVTRRRRRRKQRPVDVPTADISILPTPEATPPTISSYNFAELGPAPVPAPRDPYALQPHTRPPANPDLRNGSRPVSTPQPPSPPVPTFSTVATPSSKGTHKENAGISFGTRLRPDQVYIPQPREISLNNYAYTTPSGIMSFYNGEIAPVNLDQKMIGLNRQPLPPPKRKISRRRRLKPQRIFSVNPANLDQIYPNLPTYTPAPADFGFSNGVPKLKTPYDRPDFRSGANANLPSLINQRKQKSLFTTTNNPLDLTPVLRQEPRHSPSKYYVPAATESSATTGLPVPTTARPRLPGFPIPSVAGVTTASIIGLVRNQSSLSPRESPNQNLAHLPERNPESLFNRSRSQKPNNMFGNNNVYVKQTGIRQEMQGPVSGNTEPPHTGSSTGTTYAHANSRLFTFDDRTADNAHLKNISKGPVAFGMSGRPPRIDSAARLSSVKPHLSVNTPVSPETNLNEKAPWMLGRTTRKPNKIGLPRFINDSDFHVPASIQLQNDRPVSSPYKFGFDDRYLGGRIARHEEFDGMGRVTGFYTIEDPDGRKRLVKYVADENGFRASVVTNEQGTDNQDPAQIKIHSTSPHYVPKTIDTNPDSISVM